MFAANPVNPTYPTIHFLGTTGDSVPVRRLPAPRRRGRLLAVAGVALATVAAAFGAGYMAGNAWSPGARTVAARAGDPVPGEFRLGPGNGAPPGVVVPIDANPGTGPVPGEFRLGPGNEAPPGVVVPIE